MNKTVGVYKNIKDKGIELPQSPSDTPYFKITKTFSNNLIYVSGCGCNIPNTETLHGRVPSQVSVDDAIICARKCALNIVSAIEEAVGDLNRVKSIIKLLVYVSSDCDFHDQHLVAHGASQLFIDVFGEDIGKSTRSAIGVASLPLDFPVEVEAIIEIQ
jgi:enamine deaminase RidA (YjgF/YER057c/UK114 family)